MASLKLRLALLAAAAIAAAVVYPMVASGIDLDTAALALALAAPAAGAAVAAAAGRPPLLAAALSGVGGYASALLSLQGLPVPVDVLLGALIGAAAGGLVGALSLRLDGPAFLVATLLLAVGLGALDQALPDVTGGQGGLGPLLPLSLPVGTLRLAELTPVGDFHAVLLVATLSVALAAVLLRLGPGAAWRAIGSDRARAAASGVRPWLGDVGVLALLGGLAALSGAMAAHIARVATPQSFGADVAALPLLAALAAARQPISAALIAVATGVVGTIVLPSAGWQGPPAASALALGILAVATLFTLLPGRGAARQPEEPPIDPAAPWPVAELGLSGAALRAAPITVRARSGDVLVDAPAFQVGAGGILAVVGPNGAGKSTLLRTVAQQASLAQAEVQVETAGGSGQVVLLPQEGGGFAACSVSETLLLAAGRRPGRVRQALAQAWLQRLGLSGSGDRLCAELSNGQRRLLDLARVLLGAPGVILCDEPLAGLDDNHRAAAVACLRAAAAAGATLVVSEHDREAVRALTGQVLELRRGATAAPVAS